MGVLLFVHVHKVNFSNYTYLKDLNSSLKILTFKECFKVQTAWFV